VRRGRSTVRAVVAAAALALTLAAPALASARTAAFDLDLRTADGVRVASLAGSVNARGIGYAQLVPLSGAPRIGMVRDETAMATRQADGSLLIRGGLGTRLVVRADVARGTAEASGRLALDLRAARTVDVTGTGIATDRPYTPRKGDIVIAVGYPKGPIRIAMARRYRIVRYTAKQWSRTALLANPQRIRSVAGVLVGPSVGVERLRHLDIVRALYNAGRWTAVSGSPAAFDRHMYLLAHAHVGSGGVILRHPGGRPGQASRTFLQIREPRVARIRVGSARRGRDTLPKTEIKAAVNRGIDHLTEALAARENPTGIPARAARSDGDAATRQSQTCPTPTPTMPATVCATGPDPAVYSVPIDQMFQVILTTPNALTAYGLQWTCGSTNSYLVAIAGPCPGSTLTQAMSIEFTPVYAVTLVPGGGSTTPQQIVTETSNAEFNAVAAIGDSPAQGVYNTALDVVTPTTWGAATYTTSCGDSITLCSYPAAQTIQESGLQLAMAYHSVVTDCPGCYGTGGTDVGVQMVQNVQNSAPIQDQAQLSGSVTTGTNWQTSVATSSSFDVSANLGFFGGEDMGGIGGGYSSSTTTTNSQGGSVQASVGTTYSNWETNPVYGEGPTSSSAQATYTTFSNTIPNASGTAASAASSLQYPAGINGANAGYIPTPSQYGGNGSAPNCAGNLSTCNAGPTIAAWGSGENVANFVQGAVAAFTVDVNAPNQVAIGSVSPWVSDSFYLVDQWNMSDVASGSVWAGTTNSSFSGFGPGLQAFTQLQVLGQDQIAAATTVGPPSTLSNPNPPQGASIGAGVTTYYNAQGQVIDESSTATYTTVGLDLCAPPVLTAEMWTAGCDQDPSYTGPNSQPATVAGANPSITLGSLLPTGQAPAVQTVNGEPRQIAQLGATLYCNPGTWSGDPAFSYAWTVFTNTKVWAPVPGGPSTNAFKPTAPGTYLCEVTATNSAAPNGIGAPTGSVTVIGPAK
jgi:hypothetical protein